ncbi:MULTISPECIES: FAD-dependent monooxygenase [Pseudonocardia]|jgi:phenol 2-monooxygenase|uniref:FAD-dependent monooxygenase n=1 Tax=Pseudonocardia TaxID=1847 RepID=UPI00091074A5|nr:MULTISPECIES: FAD-dependent monooxygenase [unclassified Pseudonocardia]MCO7192791.1 FAD-dependent monooxygenase [Pseudonocardia sp. McavD-2-B]MYW75092.1 3-hydroxybenzoate 4-monooxygenase [Pseudonocardia sp. SID8383]OJG07869.1 Pentachlorophenol 4-monooxygenase [Pseudonocardia autotrophica]
MQFHLDGYRTGDPLVEDAHPSVRERPSGLPDETDVLIVGCGPAGLVLAAQLANFPDIRTVVVDRKDGPLEVGQADGVACRTVEMFEAFGLANRLIDEAYRVNEVSFWRPDPEDRSRIVRAGRVDDVEEGLSEMPHVIVNQARMLAHLREHMERSASRTTPFYGLQAGDIDIDTSGSSDHPVTVELVHLEGLQPTGESSTIRARYVVGCDGSRSGTRQAIGRSLVGDPMNQSWGVLDVLAVTDFPDIRLKCAVHSANDGNILIIPREGGYLVRLYIELDNVRDRDMLRNQDATPEKLTAVANRILHPYTLEVHDVGWWAVYAIGQRLCDKFDDVPAGETDTRLPRVFIAGDACHTHSAKAGQGMNVSMADTWNLGWKLGSVLRGTARPEVLHTYSQERQEVAQELIDFDREFAAMFSARPSESDAADGDGVDPATFQQYFRDQGRFTAGVAVRYPPSMITAAGSSQHLAPGFPVGMRFHSAPVVRLADAAPMHLGHVARADGAWRLYLFADRADPAATRSALRQLCEVLGSDRSALTRFTPAGTEPDSVIDVRAVFQQHHRDLALDRMPAVLLPRKGRFGLVDYEKMFCPDPAEDDVFDIRGVDRETGCMVLVRPDHYVAHVLPLHGHEELTDFLSGVLLPAR